MARSGSQWLPIVKRSLGQSVTNMGLRETILAKLRMTIFYGVPKD
jgi:hypothetical protein